MVALGGNALLRRGEAPESAIQERHVLAAAKALAPLAREHRLVLTHGNGPQVGLLAMENENDPALGRPYPFDVLGAQTQGMIGYWLVNALRAAAGLTAACVLTRTRVRSDDPAFARLTTFVSPEYDEAASREAATPQDWWGGTARRRDAGGGSGWPRCATWVLLVVPAT
ncbi:amino acid kinase family protein [Amycolatopsis samaneae]|uniref:Carbamate kinase n=1 Tax=Amycolatopsis samaneae TaxID=664691 RepID=A0ABW5GRB2_9PSEU